MPYQNLVVLMGHLTAQPELRYLASGKAVANFTVAVNESWKDESGQKKESVAFIGVTVFGGWAENSAKMGKGALCFVRGKLSQDTWDDKKTGAKRSKTYVTAQEVYGFEKREGQTHSTPAPPAEAKEGDDETDVPF